MSITYLINVVFIFCENVSYSSYTQEKENLKHLSTHLSTKISNLARVPDLICLVVFEGQRSRTIQIGALVLDFLEGDQNTV